MTEQALAKLPAVTVPEPTMQITQRLDKQIVHYYRATVRLWQARINADLDFIVTHRRRAKRARRRRGTR